MKNKLLKGTITLFFIAALNFGCSLISTNVFAGEMNFHSVYVGRGDALVIESNGHYMIVDSGTTAGVPLFMEYLEKLDIPEGKIDYLVSTHPDGDHVGGFADILNKYEIGEVFYSPCTKAGSYYYDFIDAVKDEGCPFSTPPEGKTWTVGDATVEVIYNGSKGSTYNECSIVLKVTCDGKSILLTGDLTSTMERSLLEQGYKFDADILKIGHHGAAASSCAAFLDAVSPEYAVISSDNSKNTSLPKPSVLKRLARRFVKTYRTTDGDVLINIKDGVISTKHKENNGYISIKKGKITLSNNVFYATGDRIKPAVTLYVDGKVVPATHYKVSYSSNKHTGVAKVKLTATEAKYVSKCSTTFLILPKKETLTASVYKHNKVKLKWSSQSHATGFQIQYSTDKSFKTGAKLITCKTPTAVGKTVSNLNYNTKYYFRVRAYKSNVGNGKWSEKIFVKTEKVPIPAKQKIKSCILKNKREIKLTWKKQSSKNKAGYRIQYSTDKSFTDKTKIKTITYKKTSKTYRTLRNLKKKTTYYIRIQGYNKYGKGKWSKVVKMKTK